MKEDEKNMIFSAIENKMNKKIIKLKKLYQATIDGGEPEIFHLKCDNIPNTLILIKSEGLRRFGGFTPIPWKSKGGYNDDPEKKSFVFSLDIKKIYYPNRSINAVFHRKNCGPCFGTGHDIGIMGNPIIENNLITSHASYNYGRDKYSLSECDYNKKGKAIEYEAFQVIFI